MFSPMLLTEVAMEKNIFEKYKDWVWQEKENGIRAIIHIRDNRITAIRNRRNYPCLHLYPELKALIFKNIRNAVLDAELVVFDQNHKSIFYNGINQRSKKLYEQNVEQYPVTICAFDIILLNDNLLIKKPYAERYKILSESFYDMKHFEIVKNIENPQEYWENKIIKENREGLVIKNPRAIYEVGIRSKNYLKLKNYKVTNVVVNEVEPNSAGTKIYGMASINNNKVVVECQFNGIFDIKKGDVLPVVYLDVFKNRLIQPHKPSWFKK